jgi:hypothetical protein
MLSNGSVMVDGFMSCSRDRLERRLQDVLPVEERERGEICGSDPRDSGAVGEVPQPQSDSEEPDWKMTALPG